MSSNRSQRTSQQDAPVKKKHWRVFYYFSNYFEKLVRQELSACLSPIPSMFYSVLFFFVLTVVAIPLGAALFWQTLENTEVILRYDDFQLFDENPLTNERRREIITDPTQPFMSNYTIRITEHLERPVYVYYELTDFYQNHKRYARSLSREQIGGETPDPDERCAPYQYLPTNDSDPRTVEERAILPCGLVAHSLFNDTFTLVSQVDADENDLGLVMEETKIATEWDRKYLYGDVSPINFNDDPARRGGGEINGTLKNDEHFMVWMRVGSLPTVRKLYGIIHDDIPKGARLTFEITNRYNTYDFDGRKRIILSTSNWTGGRNEVTGIVYFVIGTCSAVACIVILGMDLRSDRRPGDLRALSWNKNSVS